MKENRRKSLQIYRDELFQFLILGFGLFHSQEPGKSRQYLIRKMGEIEIPKNHSRILIQIRFFWNTMIAISLGAEKFRTGKFKILPWRIFLFC